MPNHVTNILNAKDLIVLPIFTEDEDGEKQLDFNKIIPMPEELNINSGDEKTLISCYLTKVQDVEIMKIVKNYYENHMVLKLFSAPHILTDEELSDIMNRYSPRTYDDLVECGKVCVDNIIKYGHASWYEWCCDNWGTKWNAYDCSIYDDNEMEFLTAWSPAEPIVLKLSEQYPDRRFHLLYSDEFIGQFAGESVYENGKLVKEIYAEGLDHPDMPELLYKIFEFTVKECVYIDKDGNVVKKSCEDCKCYDNCDRIR